MIEFEVSTDDRLEVIDVTDHVVEAMPPDVSGTVTVFVEHTTAAVTINEGELTARVPRTADSFEKLGFEPAELPVSQSSSA